MIKTNEYGGTFFIVHDNQSVTPINEQAYNAINEQNKQLQQYKSIVKAVDPDNLPDSRVLVFDRGSMFVHRLKKDEFGNILLCSVGGTVIRECKATHYIETKDIIKMMEDL